MKNIPLVLIVLDGFGVNRAYGGNAIHLAKMPFYNSLLKFYPHGLLDASGEAVGLPRGEDGNSEVGHLNLGAGRIVYQDLPRINMSIADASFFQNEVFLNAARHVREKSSALHLIGLIGSSGIHSNIEHLFALLYFAKKNQIKRVYLHLFTDGRDSPPTSASMYIKRVEEEIQNNQTGKIVSLIGRYYGMDRDKRWDRTLKAYELLTCGKGYKFKSAEDAIEAAYDRNETDEFIQASVIDTGGNSVAESRIKENDAVIFYNFRVDRPRQLTKMFTLSEFNAQSVAKSDYDPFTERYYKKMLVNESNSSPVPDRGPRIKNLFFVTMTQYDHNLPCEVAFPLDKLSNPLASVLSDNRIPQLHVSESEKEKMVTYFFNGLRDDPYKLEDRMIISSPRVATYDEKPEMSALEITDAFLQKIHYHKYPFTVINFANPDMLGHTGNIKQTIVALAAIDDCLKKICEMAAGEMHGTVLITADHGNCEEMIDSQGNIDTKHSSFPVPFVVVSDALKSAKVANGVLGDVAPTILKLFDIKKPNDMTGRNLIS